MDITKSTLWGALALVILVVAVIGYRHALQTDSRQCVARLQAVAVQLDAYAAAHQGTLPETPDALAAALGALPLSTADNQPYTLAREPRRWKQGAPQPYLWDARPHPKINGYHVLMTDGAVREVTSLSDVLP